MAIEHVVEDGTGLNNATSYVSVDYFRQYWENRGEDYTSIPEKTIKAWLNISTEQIDLTYQYWGEKANSTQALEFPRSGIMDRDGNDLATDAVPADIQKACAEIAQAYYLEGNLNPEPAIKTRAIADVTLEYRDGVVEPKYQNAMKYLKHYIFTEGKRVSRV